MKVTDKGKVSRTYRWYFTRCLSTNWKFHFEKSDFRTYGYNFIDNF